MERVLAICKCGFESKSPHPGAALIARVMAGLPCPHCGGPMAFTVDPGDDHQIAFDAGQASGWDAALHVLRGVLEDVDDIAEAREIVDEAIEQSVKDLPN